jgi:membrane protease YdiL (CAAX protease family)
VNVAAHAPSSPLPLRPDEATLVLGGIFVLFQLGGAAIPTEHRDIATPILQWITIALPVVGFLLWRGLPLRETLGLHRPSRTHCLGTVLLTVGLVGAAVLYMAAQGAIFGGIESYREQQGAWTEKLTSHTLGGLAALLLTIAVTPAICEELLFRGLLARAYAASMRRGPICVLVGVLFGLFHGLVSLQTIPAALLGMAITWLALATGSLWPAVLCHFLFNATTVVAHHLDARLGGVETAAGMQLTVAALAAAIFIPLGLLCLRGRRASQTNEVEPLAAARPVTETATGVEP